MRTRPLMTLAGLALLLAAPAAALDFEHSVEARPGGRLEVKLSSGSIEVESHEFSEVRVDAFAAGWRSGSLDIKVEGDGVNVRVEGNLGRLNVFQPRVRLRLRVPERYSVQLETSAGSVDVTELEGEVRARSSGGGISVRDVRGDVQVETSGGPIVIEEVHGRVQAKTSGGPIGVADTRGEVEVHTSGGDVRVFDVSGPVRATSSGGSIHVRFEEGGEGELETSGGGVVVELSADIGVSLEASTSGGHVHLEESFDLRGERGPTRVRGNLLGGGPSLRLKSSGGDIRILEN